MTDPWAEFRIPAQTPAAPQADPWAEFRIAKPSVAEDVVRSGVAGVGRGVVGLVGLPADVGSIAQTLVDHAQSYTQGAPLEEVRRKNAERAVVSPEALEAFGGAGLARKAEDALGFKLYEPQTTAGKYARTAGEFLPGAGFGTSVNVGRRLLTYGAAPGVASEAAGQATEGTAAEPWARAGAAVGAGLGGAWVNRPAAAGASVNNAMRGVDPNNREAMFDAAEALFQEAQQIGVPLSRANAMDAVTNGATRMSDLQRVVEGAGGMREFFAPTTQAVEGAGRQALDAIAPAPANPAMIGREAAEGAEGVINDATGIVNRATRPLYAVADPQRVGPQIQAALASDPLYAATLQEVRNTPALNRGIGNLPDDAVGVIDIVQRRMREAGENARVPGQASTSNLAAANFQDARTAPIAAAETATGSRPGVQGSYEAARATQERLRQQYVEPLMAGPLGRLATKPETKAAIDALFPVNPVPNSAQEVLTAVSALSQRNPWASRQIVRAHIESVFNETTQRLQSGPNQWGGAGFAAALRGNPQQAANLAAAIRGLPNGDGILPGFDRFLGVMEASGFRQRIGSQTAFNAEELARLSKPASAKKPSRFSGVSA